MSRGAPEPPPGNRDVERDRRVEQYLPLVHHVVTRLAEAAPPPLSRDDCYSAGLVGLMRAADSYDPERGASFKTYAFSAVRGAILDEIRRSDPVSRGRRQRLRRAEQAKADLTASLQRPPALEEVADYLQIDAGVLDEDLLALHTLRVLSLDDQIGAGQEGGTRAETVMCPGVTDPGEAAQRDEQRDRLMAAIHELSEVERAAVLHYHYDGLYLREIARLLSVSESRVSQILSRAVGRLRQKMGEKEP